MIHAVFAFCWYFCHRLSRLSSSCHTFCQENCPLALERILFVGLLESPRATSFWETGRLGDWVRLGDWERLADVLDLCHLCPSPSFNGEISQVEMLALNAMNGYTRMRANSASLNTRNHFKSLKKMCYWYSVNWYDWYSYWSYWYDGDRKKVLPVQGVHPLWWNPDVPFWSQRLRLRSLWWHSSEKAQLGVVKTGRLKVTVTDVVQVRGDGPSRGRNQRWCGIRNGMAWCTRNVEKLLDFWKAPPEEEPDDGLTTEEREAVNGNELGTIQ